MNQKLLYSLVALALLGGVWWWLSEEKMTEKVSEEKKELTTEPETTKDVAVKNEEGLETTQEDSFASLFERNYAAPAIELGSVLEENASYTKSAVTYESDDLTISGVIYVPKGTPPAGGFPVLITNHGYIDPAIYTTGRGLKREQGYFATRGYIVLHPDYRNHAGSTKSEENPIKMRLGYIVDIIHGVLALEKSTLPINRDRVALLGHSMGGGASLAAVVVKPDLVERVILYAPVSLNYQDSYERYMNDDLERKEKVVSVYGTPEANPGFWAGLNGEPYLNRLQVPVQIYHGTSDDDVPLAWSENTKKLLDENSKTAELIVYPGEEHEFGPRWTDFMEGVKKFME